MDDLFRFKYLHTTECLIVNYNIGIDKIHIAMENVLFTADTSIADPKSRGRFVVDYCELIFSGVVKSERMVIGYTAEELPDENSKKVIIDIDTQTLFQMDTPVKEFAFEGCIKSPLAFVDWQITAASCEFRRLL